MAATARLLAGALLLSACTLVLPLRVSAQATIQDLTDALQSGRYLRWAEITREGPHAVPPRISMRCYVPPSEAFQREKDRKRHGPHASTLIRVFVNRVGEAAFLPDRKGSFPPGTVIIKEKLSADSPVSPGFAFGAMVKHAAPAFSRTGGWQFLYAERTESLKWRNGAQACSSCHATRRSTDFVFAGYQAESRVAPR